MTARVWALQLMEKARAAAKQFPVPQQTNEPSLQQAIPTPLLLSMESSSDKRFLYILSVVWLHGSAGSRSLGCCLTLSNDSGQKPSSKAQIQSRKSPFNGGRVGAAKVT